MDPDNAHGTEEECEQQPSRAKHESVCGDKLTQEASASACGAKAAALNVRPSFDRGGEQHSESCKEPSAPAARSRRPQNAAAAAKGPNKAEIDRRTSRQGHDRQYKHDRQCKHEKTTVMLRSLPSGYSRTMLQELLDSEGFARKYDFAYVPVQWDRPVGLGFAFVNMLSAEDAERMFAHFNGFRRWSVASEKVCSAGWSSPTQQGYAANVARYRNSSIMHPSVPDEHQPAIFKDGERVLFPQSTRTLVPPRR